jgi:hypothetical protein
MHSLDMYCLSIDDKYFEDIKSLGYQPVGLGVKKYKKNWLRDNKGDNIANKNPFYGEYTFHYWFWKNKLKNLKKNKWVGFCTYRRFWLINKKKKLTKKNFLQKIPNKWKAYDVILGQKIYVNNFSFMKILKHGFRSILNNPKYLLKKNRNIKFHFDSFHGYGNLDKAIELLDENNRVDFKKFVYSQNSYNRSSMFICRSKKLMYEYYSTVFPWIEKCEKIFGFKNKSYGLKRIYGFLIERFQSYWFQKYANPLICPIAIYNLKENIK